MLCTSRDRVPTTKAQPTSSFPSLSTKVVAAVQRRLIAILCPTRAWSCQIAGRRGQRDVTSDGRLTFACLRAGGANQGHYHAIIKDLYGQGVWDAAIAGAQEAGAASALGGGAAAAGGAQGASKSAWGKMGAKLAGVADDVGGAEYVVEDYVERPELLIRDLVTQYEAMNGIPSGTGLYLKQLETEIAEQTGVAWNTRYKALHGTVREFVESKQHLFDVKDSLVSVVEGAAWADQAQARVSAQQAPALTPAQAPASSPDVCPWRP